MVCLLVEKLNNVITESILMMFYVESIELGFEQNLERMKGLLRNEFRDYLIDL